MPALLRVVMSARLAHDSPCDPPDQLSARIGAGRRCRVGPGAAHHDDEPPRRIDVDHLPVDPDRGEAAATPRPPLIPVPPPGNPRLALWARRRIEVPARHD